MIVNKCYKIQPNGQGEFKEQSDHDMISTKYERKYTGYKKPSLKRLFLSNVQIKLI